VQDNLHWHEFDALVYYSGEDHISAVAKCKNPLLVGHRYFDKVPFNFVIDHGCATDLAFASLFDRAVLRQDILDISVESIPAESNSRGKGSGPSALPQENRVLVESLAQGTSRNEIGLSLRSIEPP
jgi:hypothetical protein